MIVQLEKCGMTQQEIADGIGASQTYVSFLKNGKREGLNYEIGKKLVSLHKRMTKKAA